MINMTDVNSEICHDKFPENGGPIKVVLKETCPNFKELKHIEDKRCRLLLRAELPFWRILFFWTGTCLKDISIDVLLWLTIAIYVAIGIAANTLDYVPTTVKPLERTNIGILGGFLSFFLVIFVNQTNCRLLEMYGFSKACSRRIQAVAGLAQTQLPPKLDKTLVQRHFNAAHIA